MKILWMVPWSHYFVLICLRRTEVEPSAPSAARRNPEPHVHVTDASFCRQGALQGDSPGQGTYTAVTAGTRMPPFPASSAAGRGCCMWPLGMWVLWRPGGDPVSGRRLGSGGGGGTF